MNTTSDQTPRTRRPRWMIVDDDHRLLFLLHAFLTRFRDTDIVCFDNGTEAWAAFAAAPETFQMVITDLEMPGMGGLELQRRLLSLAPALPVLLITGNSTFTEADAAAAGFCGLLHKPFSFAALRGVLAAGSSQNLSGAVDNLHDSLRLNPVE